MGDETEVVICKCACGCRNEDAPVKIGICYDCGISGRCPRLCADELIKLVKGL